MQTPRGVIRDPPKQRQLYLMQSAAGEAFYSCGLSHEYAGARGSGDSLLCSLMVLQTSDADPHSDEVQCPG